MNPILQNLDEALTLRLLLAACLALPSGVLQGYAGFGGALFASPFFALLFGPAAGFSTLVILMLFSQAPLFPGALRKGDWKEFAPPSISAAITMPLGVSFLVAADPTFIRRGMGVFILIITIVMMLGYRYTGKRRIWVGIGSGGAAGAISGFFGVPAFPLAAIYLHHAESITRRDPRERPGSDLLHPHGLSDRLEPEWGLQSYSADSSSHFDADFYGRCLSRSVSFSHCTG